MIQLDSLPRAAMFQMLHALTTIRSTFNVAVLDSYRLHLVTTQTKEKILGHNRYALTKIELFASGLSSPILALVGNYSTRNSGINYLRNVRHEDMLAEFIRLLPTQRPNGIVKVPIGVPRDARYGIIYASNQGEELLLLSTIYGIDISRATFTHILVSKVPDIALAQAKYETGDWSDVELWLDKSFLDMALAAGVNLLEVFNYNKLDVLVFENLRAHFGTFEAPKDKTIKGAAKLSEKIMTSFMDSLPKPVEQKS